MIYAYTDIPQPALMKIPRYGMNLLPKQSPFQRMGYIFGLQEEKNDILITRKLLYNNKLSP